MNELQRQTLETIIAGETPSRFELSNLFGVSPQTMTRAVKGLVENGILDEQPETTGTRGQPSRRLVFRTGSLLVIGLVLANHRLIVTVEDLAGNRLLKDELAGDFSDPQSTLDKAADLITKAVQTFDGIQRIVGLGIAAQGFFIEKGRRVVSFANLKGWSEIDLKAYFGDKFNVPVTIQNDAKAIAVGTIREGLARRHKYYFCFYLGSGVGGALVHDGQLYEGAFSNAGEIGYFVPRNEHRPTVPNFLRVANIKAVDEWKDDMKQDQRILDWCRTAGESLSAAAQVAVRSYDVESIFICSYMPRSALQAICDAVRVEPIGSDLLSSVDAAQLPQRPSIIPLNDTSLNKGACALAAYHFLRFSSLGGSGG
ncbi:ROK family transcriptional regulator [Agrobacterium rhizogenes]|nr:ROK family transcriptional regulator [Rhizobium rhizogenes]